MPGQSSLKQWGTGTTSEANVLGDGDYQYKPKALLYKTVIKPQALFAFRVWGQKNMAKKGTTSPLLRRNPYKANKIAGLCLETPWNTRR